MVLVNFPYAFPTISFYYSLTYYSHSAFAVFPFHHLFFFFIVIRFFYLWNL